MQEYNTVINGAVVTVLYSEKRAKELGLSRVTPVEAPAPAPVAEAKAVTPLNKAVTPRKKASPKE